MFVSSWIRSIQLVTAGSAGYYYVGHHRHSGGLWECCIHWRLFLQHFKLKSILNTAGYGFRCMLPERRIRIFPLCPHASNWDWPLPPFCVWTLDLKRISTREKELATENYENFQDYRKLLRMTGEVVDLERTMLGEVIQCRFRWFGHVPCVSWSDLTQCSLGFSLLLLPLCLLPFFNLASIMEDLREFNSIIGLSTVIHVHV